MNSVVLVIDVRLERFCSRGFLNVIIALFESVDQPPRIRINRTASILRKA